jgi:flagellar assembly protein FliH
LSKVIKKNTEPEGVVAINISDNRESYNKPVNNAGASLDFERSIEKAVTYWKNKLDEKAAQNGTVLDNKLQDAFKKGFDEGVKAERSQREAFIKEHFINQFYIIDALLKDAKIIKNEAFRGLEKKVIELATVLAEKIVIRSIETNPKITEAIVSDIISEAINSETIILKISAKDFQIINSEYKKWLDKVGTTKNFKIEIDPRLYSGDCLIETENGLIDSTISSRLETLTEELLKVNK